MVDTSKTRDQWIEQAALLLAAIEVGEPPSAEDEATLDNLIDPLVAQLAADSVYYVQDPDALSLDVFLPLARLLANNAGPHFGSPINDEARERDERILRRLSAGKPTYENMQGEYF